MPFCTLQVLQSFHTLFNQTLDFCKYVQVIIVDDGSEDKTALLCDKYKKFYPQNIIYKYQQHKGILQARNEGLRLATGKYFCFLNADDYFTEQCLESVYHFFSMQGDDIPRVMIPVRYFEGKRDSVIRFPEGSKKVRILNLDTDYGIGVVNISSLFMKNDGSKCYLNEKIPVEQAELEYIWNQFSNNRMIGYVQDACLQVRIRKNSASVSQQHMSDMSYALEYIGGFWKNALAAAQMENKTIPYYMQVSFMEELVGLFEMEWENTDSFWTGVQEVLTLIDDMVIIDTLGMQDMSRIIHVLSKKYGEDALLTEIDNDTQIQFGNTIVGMLSYQSVVIHFIEIRDNRLIIEGDTSIPKVIKCEDINITIEVNGRCEKGVITSRSADKTLLGENYEYCRGFYFEYPLVEDHINIRFGMAVGDKKAYYNNIVCMRFSPVSNEVREGYAERGGYILKVRQGELICEKNKGRCGELQEQKYCDVLENLGTKDSLYAKRFRSFYRYFKAKKRKELWLFLDRIDKADDNGEAMFRYVASRKDPNIEAFFIIGREAEDYKELMKVGNVVAANSPKHQMLHVLADYIFTSQVNGFVENPFGSAEKFFRDIYHLPKMVFLQHGITKDNQTKWLNRFNQNLYSLITSCKAEYDSFMEYPYYYSQHEVWLTGMPRFDRLYHDERRYILVMPTWRKKCMEQKWDAKREVYCWNINDDFQASQYCKTYTSLLNNKQFKEICDENGYKIVFMPHPIVQPYVDQFSITEDILILPYSTKWRDLFAQCNLMITDYSSVAFDFAYLRKPILYYQFDREDFFAGHSYTEGYFDYAEDGFGEVVTEEKEMIERLREYIRNDCMIKEKYRNRIDNFFMYHDDKCCERIYDRIVGDAW